MLKQTEELAESFCRKTVNSSGGIAMRLKAVVQARIHANLSLVGELQDDMGSCDEHEIRPKSAPVTVVEDQKARMSAASANMRRTEL